MRAWCDAGHALYRDALERRLAALCAPYWAPACAAPQAALCQRVDRFLDELFAFVLDSAVPAGNTLAERCLRPLVIARKVSGGTRSEAGSATRMALASLFATCLALLRHPALAV